MMGRSHALSGWCVGLALAPALELPTLPTLLFATIVAGYSLLPDLDCEGATASRVLGPITGGISKALRATSRGLYAISKGPRDENCDGTHRHFSHTALFAGALGGLTAWGGAAWGRWFIFGVLAFGILLAEDALGDWILPVALGGGLLMAVTGNGLSTLDDIGGWLGIAVGVGCFTHCLGDALTLSGCPFLFPIPIAGETWYELRPPRALRFRTGGDVETHILFPAFTTLGVLLVPGVWTLATTILGSLFTDHIA